MRLLSGTSNYLFASPKAPRSGAAEQESWRPIRVDSEGRTPTRALNARGVANFSSHNLRRTAATNISALGFTDDLAVAPHCVPKAKRRFGQNPKPPCSVLAGWGEEDDRLGPIAIGCCGVRQAWSPVPVRECTCGWGKLKWPTLLVLQGIFPDGCVSACPATAVTEPESKRN
jgi:hypothetical protein